MSLLITPTLLNSYDWLKKCPQSWKERAYNDLSNTLNRAKWKPSEAILRGIDFERNVQRIVESGIDPSTINSSDNFKNVCKECKGGKFQVKAKKFVRIDSKEYVLFNKIDVVLNDMLIDLKTTGNYRGENSYLSGWQHKFYTVVKEVSNFQYLVAEWSDVENKDFSIKDLHYVKYYAENLKEVEKEIIEHIKEFINFVEKNEDLSVAYYTKYNLF